MSDRSDRLFATRVPPRQLARFLLAVVLVGYGALAIVGVTFETRSAVDALLSGLFAVTLVLLQMLYLSRPDIRPRWPWNGVALGVQAVLVFLPSLIWGPVWFGLPGFLAGSVLIVLPVPIRLPVFVLTVAAVVSVSLAGMSAVEMEAAVPLVYLITSTTTCALAVYGLSTLSRLVDEAHTAREQLSRVAVARERLQFARTMHELLGESLSAIALRCELVMRLAERNADRARAELADVLVLARRAAEDIRTVAGLRRGLAEEEPVDEQRTPITRIAPRLARLMLTIVLFGYVVVAVARVGSGSGIGLGAVAGVLGLVAIALIVVCLSGRPTGPSRYVVLAVLAVLAFAPAPLMGPSWHGFPAFLGGAVLIVLPAAVGVPVLVLVVGATMALEAVDPAPTSSLAISLLYTMIGMVIVSITVYGLATLARLVVEVHAARDDLSRLAVARERIRIARDVHDLLGLSLSAIILKCELACRLAVTDPDRAVKEVAGILDAARRALSDARAVIGVEQRLSLSDEWELVESTLSAAAVDVRLLREGRQPDEVVGTVLASVLREGVTNVLRHSDAEWCEIAFHASPRLAVLDIVNDGVRSLVDRDQGSCGGNGLVNLTDRVEALGGRLVAGVDGEVHRLRASVPIPR